MPEQLKRYYNETIIEHLASQYVLGLLTTKTQARVKELLKSNQVLEQRILYWQQHFSSFDKQTVILEPKAQTWQHINNKLNQIEHNEIEDITRKSFWSWLYSPQFASAVAIATIAVLSYLTMMPFNDESLNYIAVLTDKNQQAQLVVSTYSESRKFIINVINMPKIANGQDLEMWVISKTDQQARSLGIIPRDTSLVQKQLTNTQWRLIKNSNSFIVTVEKLGGSSIGEPSELVVYRGLCVRLTNWQKNS